MKTANCLLKTVLIYSVFMVSLTAYGQQLINGDFESWEGNEDMMSPIGWTTSNLFNDPIQYISVQPTTDACNGDYSISISSTAPSLEGPGPGVAYQDLILNNMVSSVNINYSYDVFSLSQGTYAKIRVSAILVTDNGTIIVGEEELIYNEMTAECTMANLFVETDIPFNKIRIGLSAHPYDTGFSTEGLSIIRFDDIVLSTTVSAGSISNSALEISLQPNPVSSRLTIKTDALIQELSLIDINGKLIKKLNPDDQNIDMNNLSSGIYILRITTPDGIYNEKVMKE